MTELPDLDEFFKHLLFARKHVTRWRREYLTHLIERNEEEED